MEAWLMKTFILVMRCRRLLATGANTAKYRHHSSRRDAAGLATAADKKSRAEQRAL